MRPSVAVALSLAATLAGTGRAAVPGGSSGALRTVRWPASLRKVCAELSRRFPARVTVDPTLQDLRVVWTFRDGTSLETTLARLAELTDSRLIRRPPAEGAAGGKPRFLLERKPDTARHEAAWRREGILRTLRELLRAVEQHERGKIDVASFSTNVRPYLEMGRASQLQYLRRLSPLQVDRLLAGEVVRFPPGTIPDREVEAIIKERHPFDDPEQIAAPRIQAAIDGELRRVRERGLGYYIDFERKGYRIHLLLDLGGTGGNVVAALSDDELGLPLTRTNPYRLLEPNAKGAGAAPPAVSLRQQRLAMDLRLPPDGRWESILRALARASGREAISDGYLCRYRSREGENVDPKLVLASRGVSLADALDAICRRYQYLWWEKDDCLYFRSRAWAWDAAYEAPDDFMDRWTGAIEQRRAVGPPEMLALASLTPLQLSGLDALSGSRFLGRTGLGSEHSLPRHFLRAFPTFSVAQQYRLMGPGLTVSPEQDPLLGFSLPSARSPGSSPQLQLRQKVVTNTSIRPPVATVQMTLKRRQPPSPPGDFPFTIYLPLLVGPFADD